MTYMVSSDAIVKVELIVADCRIMERRDWDPYEIFVESYISFGFIDSYIFTAR